MFLLSSLSNTDHPFGFCRQKFSFFVLMAFSLKTGTLPSEFILKALYIVFLRDNSPVVVPLRS